MLQNNLRDSIKATLYYAVVFFLIFYILPGYAQQNGLNPSIPTAETMLVNISNQIPSLTRMVTAICYVTGFYFVIMGLIKLKHFGESRTMMSQEHSLRGPLILLTAGTLMIYIPTSVQVGMSTFWTDPNPYGYLQSTDEWSEFINVCYVIVQFVGLIAFFKGLLILTHLGGHGTSPGTFGKALTHIIGGIFCINVYQFVQVIMATLGVQIS